MSELVEFVGRLRLSFLWNGVKFVIVYEVKMEEYELIKWIVEMVISEEGCEFIGLIGDFCFLFECGKEVFCGVKEWCVFCKVKEMMEEEE